MTSDDWHTAWIVFIGWCVVSVAFGFDQVRRGHRWRP